MPSKSTSGYAYGAGGQAAGSGSGGGGGGGGATTLTVDSNGYATATSYYWGTSATDHTPIKDLSKIIAVAGGGGGGMGGSSNDSGVNITNFSVGVRSGTGTNFIKCCGGAAGAAGHLTKSAYEDTSLLNNNPVLNGYNPSIAGTIAVSAAASGASDAYSGLVSTGYQGGDPFSSNVTKNTANFANHASSFGGGGGGGYNAIGSGGSQWARPWGADAPGTAWAGGGGAGWFGGGGGTTQNTNYNGGGGGGSSYVRSDVKPLTGSFNVDLSTANITVSGGMLGSNVLKDFVVPRWRYDHRYSFSSGASPYNPIFGNATVGELSIQARQAGSYHSGLCGFAFIIYLGPDDPATNISTKYTWGNWPYGGAAN